MSPPAPNRAVIQEFLASTVRQHIHLVAIVPDGAVTAKWFGNDAPGAAAWAAARNRRGAGVYFSVNVVAEGLDKKASKNQITSTRFVHVDIDPPFNREQVLAELGSVEYPPSFIIDSGNGLQPFWRLRGGGEPTAAVERCNQLAAFRFGGDHCHNVDRVMRLPGTVNHPNQQKRLKGRIERLSTIIEQDWGDSVPLANLLRTLPGPRQSREDAPEAGSDGHVRDSSRSADAFRMAHRVRSEGGTLEGYRAQLAASSRLAEWSRDDRQVLRAWTRSATSEGRSSLRLNSAGKPLSNLANVLTMLRNTAELQGLIAHDEMAREAVLTATIPTFGEICEHADQPPRLLSDDDATRLQEFFQAAGLIHVSKDTVQNALDVIAREHSFHPLRDHLTNLNWDGVRRVDTWLTQYCGAEESEYTRKVGRMFLVGMMARIARPGCKVDHIPILEGVQGGGKSTVCAILGGEWFSDSLPELRAQKEVSQHLRGKWLIEIGELHAMSNAENALLKLFLARTEERYRPTYGRREVREPRQCVFIGTTNGDAYLKDETGGRRFWPVKVGDVLDTAALMRDRSQLLAEAWEACCRGEAYWPDRDFESRYARPQQSDRYEVDAWESIISEFLDLEEQVTVQRVAQAALHIEIAALDRLKQARIIKILKRLKWTRARTSQSRFWERPK